MSYTDSYNTAELRSEKDARAKFTEVEIWLKKIEQAKSDKKREAWMRDSRNSISMYESGEMSAMQGDIEHLTGANLWHSNIETIVPALYNSSPIPDVRVRFGDPDQIQQAVCDLTERALSYDLDRYDYDDIMKEVVRQAEMTGWGIARIRYKPKTGPSAISATGNATSDNGSANSADADPELAETLISDDDEIEAHPWDRFIVSPARNANKVTWVAFEWDMTLDEIDDLVPPHRDEDTGEMVLASAKFEPDHSGKDDDTSRDETEPSPDNPGLVNTMTVYELWDKKAKKVWFITPKDKKFPIRVEDDPLGVEGFFPVPKVLYSKRRVSSVQPISPWTVYKRRFQLYEELSQRIAGLISQIRVRGLYAKELEADFELLKDCKDGEYVPAKDVTQFMSGGGKGLESAIAHWPLQQLVEALKQCVDELERVKQAIFEETGLSDILRGATNPNETLGAQKIKASWGSQRVQDMQQDIAELNRAVMRMKAQIRAKFTPWPLLMDITGMSFPPEPVPQPDAPQPPQQTGDPAQDQQAGSRDPYTGRCRTVLQTGQGRRVEILDVQTLAAPERQDRKQRGSKSLATHGATPR